MTNRRVRDIDWACSSMKLPKLALGLHANGAAAAAQDNCGSHQRGVETQTKHSGPTPSSPMAAAPWLPNLQTNWRGRHSVKRLVRLSLHLGASGPTSTPGRCRCGNRMVADW